MTEVRNVEQEVARFHTRIRGAVVFVSVCFGLLFARFGWLQWHEHDRYLAKAEDNRVSLVPIPPERGVITDRNGIVLARNYSAFSLEITPSKLTDTLDHTIASVSALVDIEPRDRRRFARLLEDSRSFESVPIRAHLTDEEIARFSAQQYRFPGVEIHARSYRQYPLGAAAAHAIGYIGRVSKKDEDRLDAMSEANSDGSSPFDPRKDASNYKGTDFIGKTGVEQSYEAELHGLTGYEEVEVSASGRPVRTLATKPASRGEDLVMSIDIRLQELAEALFAGHRGALVAIEPTTGEVLAFVSAPSFDPNLFVEGIDPTAWDELNNSPDKPLLDRPLHGTYPPGSTYKPFMALAALALHKRTPSWGFQDPGHFTLGNHTFRDDNPNGHGWIDMQASIVHSCDTYYYMLANDLGVDAIHDFMKPFGFGQLTGIDINGESRGILPSTEWKRSAYRKVSLQKWYDGETISLGIGQGYNSFTILQLANAEAILANDGVAMKPHLVKATEDPLTHRRTPLESGQSYRIPLRQADIDVVKRAMVAVTHSGTAAKVFAGAQYESGGKTGTAQTFSLQRNQKYVSHAVAEAKRDHALYTAFAPAEHPTIALALIVENGGWGGEAAAPIARKLLDFYLLKQWPKDLAEPAVELQAQAQGSDDDADEPVTQAGVARKETGAVDDGVQSASAPTLEDRVRDTLTHRPEAAPQKKNPESATTGLPHRLTTQQHSATHA